MADMDTKKQDQRRSRGRPQIRSDDETRYIIYEAARHEFAESGYAATSMETVARRAGVSTRTLYRLVPAKASLFESMVSDRIDRFVSTVSLHGCDHSDVETALQAALMICAELILDPEVVALYRMMLAEGDVFPHIPETFYKKAMQRTVAALAEWLRARQKRGLIALDNVDEAAGMLLGMLVFEPQRAALYGHQLLPDRKAISERASACAKLFLRGAASSMDR
jgi:AcrR family transcriptional regulator